MTEHGIVRSLVLRVARDIAPNSQPANRMIFWAGNHATWLLGDKAGKLWKARQDKVDTDEDGPVKTDHKAASARAKAVWKQFLAGIEAAPAPQGVRPHVLDLAESLGRLLNFGPFDAQLLTLMIACERLPRVKAAVRSFGDGIGDLPAVLGELAGAEAGDAARRVRRSDVLKLGLFTFGIRPGMDDPVDIRWPLCSILDREPTPEGLACALAGRRHAATLDLNDFTHVRDTGFLVSLLQGAVRERAHGVNILIHGPPGTGKTELARTLAAASGCPLHDIGEADDDGEEPSRRERVMALMLAQRVLGDRSGAVLLFDEMEDLIGAAERSGGDWFAKREGSKVFVNRLLETNVAPVIWITNAIGNIDDAILRRMSFVLKLDLPPREAAHRILGRIVRDEGGQPGEAIHRLVDQAPETATVLRVAVRAARLAGESDCGARAATSLVRALRDGELPPEGPGALDLGAL